MLRSSEKIMTSISSGSGINQWPQNQALDDQKSFMASSSANKATGKTIQDPHQQPPLKCPRCDSSNTKFCYYNNYSMSQPRHFCKACKRYWTRGGTLRNVPVGGGCRKNKRAKRQPSNGGDGISSAATANPSVQPQMDLSPASNSPLFCSLPSNHLELSFPLSSLGLSRVSTYTSGFDLPQMNGLGTGFSSGLMAAEVQNSDYKNGFNQIQDFISTSSSPQFSSAGNHSLLFGSSDFASTSSMVSLLASGIQQQRFSTSHGLKGIQGADNVHLMPNYGDTQMRGGNGEMGKEVNAEGENRLFCIYSTPAEQINSYDPSSLLWNTTNVGAWFDPSNVGSSVPSL